MNLLDLIIILLLVTAVGRGLQAGLLQLLLSSLGFIVGLFAGSRLAPIVALHFSSPLNKLLVVLVIELGLAFTLAGLGEVAGLKLSAKAVKWHLGRLNRALGAALEVGFILIVVWLTASALTNVRSYGLGQLVRRSWIIRQLDGALPSPPGVFAKLEKIVSPNGFPNVFLGLEPEHTTVSPTNSVDNQAVLNDEKSVVKIKGVGCGGVISGSGFVVDKDVVVTNAHVVAGILNPRVIDQFGTHAASAIWFDPNLDLAVLRVDSLNEPPLSLASRTLPDSYASAVLGFPGGGPLVAENSVIIDHVTAAGRNIYNQGVVFRNIYEVQADIEPGNSGGPLLAPDGSVAGVVFAKSLSQNNIGYALLIDQIKPLINKAETQNSRVTTGDCAAD